MPPTARIASWEEEEEEEEEDGIITTYLHMGLKK